MSNRRRKWSSSDLYEAAQQTSDSMSPEVFHRCSLCTLLFEVKSPPEHAVLLFPTRIQGVYLSEMKMDVFVSSSGMLEYRPQPTGVATWEICAGCLAIIESLKKQVADFRDAIDGPLVDVDQKVHEEIKNIDKKQGIVVDRRRVR